MDENETINKINNEIHLLKNQLIEKNNIIEKLKQVPEASRVDVENRENIDKSKFNLNNNNNNNNKYANDFPMVLYSKIVKTLNVGDKYNEFIKFIILKVIANDYGGNNDMQSMMNIILSPQIQLLWKELYLKSKTYSQLCNLLGGEGVNIQYDQDELDYLI